MGREIESVVELAREPDGGLSVVRSWEAPWRVEGRSTIGWRILELSLLLCPGEPFQVEIRLKKLLRRGRDWWVEGGLVPLCGQVAVYRLARDFLGDEAFDEFVLRVGRLADQAWRALKALEQQEQQLKELAGKLGIDQAKVAPQTKLPASLLPMAADPLGRSIEYLIQAWGYREHGRWGDYRRSIRIAIDILRGEFSRHSQS